MAAQTAFAQESAPSPQGDPDAPFEAAEESDPVAPADESGAMKPFNVGKRTEFACAEVAMDRNGGTARHEITLGKKRVERCLLEKVGTRLHECKKFKYKRAAVDLQGVVWMYSQEGPVKFWLDKNAQLATEDISTVEGRGAVTFTFPDNEYKYLCRPFR